MPISSFNIGGDITRLLQRKVRGTKFAPKKDEYMEFNIEGGDRDVQGDQLLRFVR